MSSYVVTVRAEKGLLLGGVKVHESTPMARKWAEDWAEALEEALATGEVEDLAEAGDGRDSVVLGKLR